MTKLFSKIQQTDEIPISLLRQNGEPSAVVRDLIVAAFLAHRH